MKLRNFLKTIKEHEKIILYTQDSIVNGYLCKGSMYKREVPSEYEKKEVIKYLVTGNHIKIFIGGE